MGRRKLSYSYFQTVKKLGDRPSLNPRVDAWSDSSYVWHVLKRSSWRKGAGGRLHKGIYRMPSQGKCPEKSPADKNCTPRRIALH